MRLAYNFLTKTLGIFFHVDIVDFHDQLGNLVAVLREEVEKFFERLLDGHLVETYFSDLRLTDRFDYSFSGGALVPLYQDNLDRHEILYDSSEIGVLQALLELIDTDFESGTLNSADRDNILAQRLRDEEHPPF